MKFHRMLPVAVAALAGCSGDSVSKMVEPDAAVAIRWVNAVPDTMPMDYRIVDVVTNANEASIAYRASSGNYRPLPPGDHRIRVFLAGTTAAGNAPSVVQTVVLDTSFTFVVNHYYTIMHAGYMKAGAATKHRLIITDDVFPAPAAGTIAVRAVNALANAGPAAVFATMTTGTTGAVATPAAFPSLAFAAVSPYTSMAAAPTSPTTTTYRFTATTAGSTTPLLADGLAPVGAAAVDSSATSVALNAVAGTQQSGSVLTVIALPPAVSYVLTASGTNPAIPAGTTSTVAGTTTGSILTLLDKNPKDKLLGQ